MVNVKLRRGKDVFPPGLDEDEKIFFLSGVFLSYSAGVDIDSLISKEMSLREK
jgi:hypothetical protein